MRVVIVALVGLVVLLPLLSVEGSAEPGLVPGMLALGGFLLLAYGLLLSTGNRQPGRGREDPEVRDRYFLASLLLAGFVVRVLIALAVHRLDLHQAIAPDEDTFHRNGRQFMLWLQGESPYRVSARYVDSLQVGYYYLVGLVYYVFGEEPLLPILLNCVAGTLAALPVFRIAMDLGGRDAARPAAVLATFFPSVLLWSTLLVRDSLVILVLLYIMVLTMSLRRELRLSRLVALLLLFGILGTLRQYLFILVAASAVASFLVGRAGRTSRSLVLGVVVIVGLLALVKYVGFGLWELERASLHNLNLHRQYNAIEATGSIMPGVDISEPAGALTYLPIGMLYFLGSPFPWQVLSPRQLMALPDVLVWYLLLPPIFLGLAHVVRRRFRDASVLLITTTMITVLYSLVEGNVGIIFRHRAQIIVPMMVLAGVGIAIRKSRAAPEAAPARAVADPSAVAPERA